MSLKKLMKPVWKAGFQEKNAALPDGTLLHYAEGPENGNQPLLLIHGQTGAWQDYASVLPKLCQSYHVFVLDCHGHGKSSKGPEKYSAMAMCKDFAWFLSEVAGGPAVVSGHSSGGLLAAYLAANDPALVSGVVLEDPPFFSTEWGERWEKSFAYVDTYAPMHAFLNQSEESDWILYYLKHASWAAFLGDKKMGRLISYGERYRRKHPGKPLNYWFLPDSVNHMFWFIDDYDLRFGESFYNGSWFREFDQEKTLRRILCPAVLLHTRWSVDENGILMAAMSGNDAQRASRLIPNCELISIDSSHDAHFEKPQEFLDAFTWLKRLKPMDYNGRDA